MGDFESRAEMLGLERVRWDQLQRLLTEIPVDRFDEPALNPDGWSVRDLAWHLARWNEVIAEQLELMKAGTFDERFDWNTEENNAAFMAEARSVSVQVALSALSASRRSRSMRCGAFRMSCPPAPVSCSPNPLTVTWTITSLN
jgi:hypothetical protein